jgi:hypothetical protein
MSALVEPSRAVTPSLPPLVVPSAPAVGSFTDRQLRPARCSRARESVEPRDQNRSTVPSRRGAISSLARRWRNDSRRLPSYRPPCLPPQIHAAFQPRRPDASRRRTEPCAMPSLLRSSMTLAHRCARALAFVPAPLRRQPRASRHGASPPLAAHLWWEMGCRPPRQRNGAVCEWLVCPPADCLAAGRGARTRCVRPTSASQCFDCEHPCLVSLPAALRGLRLAPSPEGLRPG